jgi:hypothetical protein
MYSSALVLLMALAVGATAAAVVSSTCDIVYPVSIAATVSTRAMVLGAANKCLRGHVEVTQSLVHHSECCCTAAVVMSGGQH